MYRRVLPPYMRYMSNGEGVNHGSLLTGADYRRKFWLNLLNYLE